MLIINIPNEMFLQNSLLLERAAREISSSVLPCTNLGTAHNDAFTSRDIMNVARLIAEVTITIMTMKNSKVKKKKRNFLDSGNNDHSFILLSHLQQDNVYQFA